MRQRMICDSYCFVLYAMLYAYTIRGIIHLDWNFDVSISSVMPLVACVIAIYLTSITTIGISTMMLLYCPRVIAFIYVVILPIIIESVLCTELKETLQDTILGKESYGLYTFLMLATLTVFHILFYITYFMHKVKILRTFVKGVILEYVSNFKILFKLFTTIFFKVALFIFMNNLVDKNIAKTDIDNIITIFLSVWSFSSLIYTLNLLAIIIAENHKEKRHILYKASSATFAGLGTAYFAGLIYPLRLIAIVLKYRDTASANFALKLGMHINNGIVYIIDTITFSLYTRNNPFCIFYAHKNDANYYTSLRYSHDIYRKSKMKLSHFTFPLLTFFTPICIFIVILALRMLDNLTYLSTYMLAVITTMIFGLYLFIIFVEAINVCKIFGNATYTTEAINEIANKSMKVEIL